MKDTMIGMDLAKCVFQVHGASMRGEVQFRRKLTREQFRAFMAVQASAVVVFEACGSASYWAREMAALGHGLGDGRGRAAHHLHEASPDMAPLVHERPAAFGPVDPGQPVVAVIAVALQEPAAEAVEEPLGMLAAAEAEGLLREIAREARWLFWTAQS